MVSLYYRVYDWLTAAAGQLDGLASLGIRLYLAPVMLAAGWEKLNGENWFSFSLDSFPFPFNVLPPDLSWFLATWTEFLGGILLILGLAVRWISIPLRVVMWVGATAIHLDNGWAAIAPSSPSPACIQGTEEQQSTGSFERFILCYNVNERTIEASKRLKDAREVLQDNQGYSYLKEYGSYVKLNNGVEFAVTYFLMLLALLVIGGGRYFSLDYWLSRVFR